jgi:hypothetical protein
MFSKKYTQYKDNEVPLLPKNSNINEVSDNRVRYITFGIVKLAEPLKDRQNQNRVYAIYDSFEQTMITFDVNTIYEKYIKNGIENLDTKFGKFKLTQKTIDDITMLMTKSYDCY